MNNFRILGKLGEGTYSSVLKVRRLTDGLEYALKTVKIAEMKDKDKENAMNELRILASIDDTNIIGYKVIEKVNYLKRTHFLMNNLSAFAL